MLHVGRHISRYSTKTSGYRPAIDALHSSLIVHNLQQGILMLFHFSFRRSASLCAICLSLGAISCAFLYAEIASCVLPFFQ